MRRSVLVKVPSFSRNDAAGSTTSAKAAVSVRKMSWTTRKSSASSASMTCVGVGVGDDGVLAHDVHRLELAADGGVHHLDERETRLCRELALGLPVVADAIERAALAELLVAGQAVGQAREVAGALHVVLPTQRVHAGSRPADVAGEHGEVRERAHLVGARGVLRDAHRVDDRGGIGRAVRDRELADVGQRDAGDFGSPLEVVVGDQCAQRLEALGALGDERRRRPGPPR